MSEKKILTEEDKKILSEQELTQPTGGDGGNGMTYTEDKNDNEKGGWFQSGAAAGK